MDSLIHTADENGLFIYTVDYDNLEVLYTNRVPDSAEDKEQPPKHCYQMILGQDAPCADCPMISLRGSRGRYLSVKNLKVRDRWMMVEYSDVPADSGGSVCVVTVADVTQLRGTIYNMKRMLNNIRAAAYTIDMKDYRLQFINRELKNMLPDIHEHDLCYQALWDRDSPCTFCPIRKIRNDGLSAHFDRYNQKLNRHLSFDVMDITDIDGVQLTLFTAYDISRLVESENRLKEVAYTDVLTSVKNRNAFLEKLALLYKQQMEGCICLLNIKQLKRYNVLYGKKEGDTLIKKIAFSFSALLDKENVYRIDGAKLAFFAVGESESIQLRKKIGQVIDGLMGEWDNLNFQLNFDTVFVSFPQCAHTPEELIFNGEYLLRKCGRVSNGGILEFDQNEHLLLKRRNHIEGILQCRDYKERFQVYYQPIYDIKTSSFSKCEALLRLYDEELGQVSPLEFIPIAEETGHIGELGNFVLREVCSFLAERNVKRQPPIQVNVNVSGIEFARSGFLEEVISITSYWKIPSRMIQFEITESIFMNSMDYVVRIMNALIERGFTFAIDDFGTGYSSLNYIGTMPLNCLKIDKSFIDQLLQSESYKLIITSIIEIAKGLHMAVVAEGIESNDQFELIKAMGTNFIQGYLFSRPLPRKEYETFLQNN